jgi:hypothetical protein
MARAISATASAWSGADGESAGDHVGVADGLDLLQPVTLGQLVERREQLVQDLHHLLGPAALAAPGEVHQVGEQHGDLGKPVSDQILVRLESGGDRPRQHVEQQPLGPLFLPLQGAAGAHRLPRAAARQRTPRRPA